MNLPKDPVMLLSVVNTQLRDHYPTLTELAAAYMTDADAITETLAAINYHYDEGQNQFYLTGNRLIHFIKGGELLYGQL